MTDKKSSKDLSPSSVVVACSSFSLETYKAQLRPDWPRKKEDVCDGHTGMGEGVKARRILVRIQ